MERTGGEQSNWTPLEQLYTQIDQRGFTIVRDQPNWPCRKGCDNCCRQLAEVPELTEAEWRVLRQGFLELDVSVQTVIATRIRALSNCWEEQLTCPFINELEGTCHVYHFRPVACRMYGFYMSYHDNRWCHLIQSQYETGIYDGVVFGNHNAIERELRQNCGDTKSLIDWFEQI